MPHDKRVSYGVAAVIACSFDVLLLKRKGSHAAGHWACPGGWVDFGERSRETVVREGREELGVELEVLQFLTTNEQVFPAEVVGPMFVAKQELQSLTLYYLARITEGTPAIKEPHKCEELRWVDIRKPETWPTPMFPGLREVFDSIHDRYKTTQRLPPALW